MTRESRAPRPRLQRLARFGLAGIAATATDFGVFNLGVALAGDPGVGLIIGINTLAFSLATAVSYYLNARFTFEARRERRSLLRYVLVALSGGIVYDASLLAMLRLIEVDDTLLLNGAKTAAVVLSATWNFTGFTLFAFPARPAADDVRVSP